MNIIKTVGDLKKALSVYDDNLPIKVVGPDSVLELNNDTQLSRVQDSGKERFEIRLGTMPDLGRPVKPHRSGGGHWVGKPR